MIDDFGPSLDIYRAANMLIDRHGDDALIEAGRMIDQMLPDGDSEGRIVWGRIKRAIEALQADRAGRCIRSGWPCS